MTNLKTGKTGPKTVQKARPGNKGAFPSAVVPGNQNRLPDPSAVNVPKTPASPDKPSQVTKPGKVSSGTVSTKA